MTIDVHRTGLMSNRSLGAKITEVFVRAEYGKAWMTFKAMRGTGKSYYSLILNPDSYADVIRAMLQANPEAAVKAIGSTLEGGIPERKLEDGQFWSPAQAA